MWMVVANSFKVVREVLVNHGESVSDRPPTALQEEIAHGRGEQILHTQAKICSQVCDSHIEKPHSICVLIYSFK